MAANLRALPEDAHRAVLYLRQSVARDDSISLELQESAGRDYCAKQGYTVIAVETDEGLSGRNWSKRPAVHRVLDLIENRQADVIVLWKWSRLSRNRKDWALAADRVEVAGGRIESATEPIDTGTASGRFARGVMTEYAAFQSEQIGEQWQEVFERRVKLGLSPTGAMPWGWESVDGTPTISDANAATIREMYRLYNEGHGLVYIANWMTTQGHKTSRGKTWQFASVRACLESPFHAGFISYRGREYPGVHTPIIGRDEYDRFMRTRRDRTIEKRPRKSAYLLSTICVCHCGRKRVGNVSSKRKRSYGCTATEPHKNKYRVCHQVDALVSEWVMSLDVEATLADPSAPVDTHLLEVEIARADKAITNLNVMLAQGRIDDHEYDSAKTEIVEQRSEHLRQLDEAKSSTVMSPAAFLRGKGHLVGAWPLMATEEQQSFLRSIVRFVKILADDSIEVHTRWGEVVHCGS